MTVSSAAALTHPKTAKDAWHSEGFDRFANLFDRSPAAANVTTREWLLLSMLVCVGASLRFWGMGSWGLQYDEETMAMPVMHIVEHGTPVMPSGMTYVRAIAQLYLMAGSVWLFGPTEWALRLPSAICSLGLIVAVFFLGRRFLTPIWNLAFVAAITLLPAMILDAHEARMYVFLITSVTCFALCVFRWERTERTSDLILAVAVMMVAVQFQSLAIFASFIVLMPGLLNADTRKLLHAVIALTVIAIGFLLIDGWVESYFPPQVQVRGLEITAKSHAQADIAVQSVWLLSAGFVCAVGLAHWIRKSIPAPRINWLAAVLVLLGLTAQLLMLYHLAGLLLIAGAGIAYRAGARGRWLWATFAYCVVLFAVQAWLLLESGVPLNRKLAGSLLGVPSVWTFLRFAEYAPLAATLVAVAFLGAIAKLIFGRRIPEFWLYFVLSVWLPLFLIGFFTWYTQLRYTEIALVPLLLTAFAVFQGAWRGGAIPSWNRGAAVAAVACLVIVNPLATAKVVNAGYSIHPDHKGAAEFVRSVQQPGDLLLAEDVLQQTYYLGRVDYWLIGEFTARIFTRDFDGRSLDIYTHTPSLSRAADLQALIARADRGSIYIIGSGEEQHDGRRHARGPELFPLLASMKLETVFEGRDGLTKVWRIPPSDARPRTTAEAVTSSTPSSAIPSN